MSLARIDRAEAMARIAAAHSGGCPLCGLGARGDEMLVARSEHGFAALSRFPVCWGQIVVALDEHLVSYAQVSAAQWSDLSLLALRCAQMLEAELAPARCYLTATGSSEEGLPMTTPHIHINVIPVDDPTLHPKEVLTWDRGIVVADDRDWHDLGVTLRGRNQPS